MIRRLLPTAVAALILLLLPLLLFAPVALGNRTLLPADALFLFEPYRAAAAELGVTRVQNGLVADLILENYAWKRFILQALQNRELPLWDPYIFAGHPFLANGQHSALYPLSLVFYVLPLWRAFGVFAWLQLGLAGLWTYLFARVLGIRRLGALLAGIVFQLSGFMVVSVVHPMIIAGASWLPFILAMVELIVCQRPALGQRPSSLPWALLGAVGLGCHMLAGHAENTYFVLLVTALYATWRLSGLFIGALREHRVAGAARRLAQPLFWLALMLILGLALGAVQFIPLYEVAADSFRSGQAAASLSQVLGWAYPPRRLIAFGIPNFFGNPAHHSYFDLFQWRTVPVTTNAYGNPIDSTDWGIKNYVEGGAYLGLLPLLLAVLSVAYRASPIAYRLSLIAYRKADIAASDTRYAIGDRRYAIGDTRYTVPFFTLLSLFSLGCIFGTPLYALVYALPYISQSHSPFRWVFPLTLSVAVLAGFGVEEVQKRREAQGVRSEGRGTKDKAQGARGRWFLLGASPSLVSALAALAFWGGLLTLAGLALSRVFFARIEPLVERLFLGLALAPNAFPDHRAFYSYEFKWVALFGLLLTATGIVLRLSHCPITLKRRPLWEFLAVGLLVVDMVSFGAGFHPAVDPALLDYTPPVVEFLRQDTTLWRYATFTPPGTTKTMNANTGMFYNLQAVNGYDSLFSRQYADYMGLIEEQDELQYNRIASFSDWSSLDSPLMDLLNVRYILSEVEIPNPAKYRLVYRDESVYVYENLAAMSRAFTLPASAAVVTQDVATALRTYDPHQFVVLEREVPAAPAVPQLATATPQAVVEYTMDQVTVDATLAEPGWLVLGDSYFPGWRAFVRPQGGGTEAEQEVEILRADGNFRAVFLEAGAWSVRFKYSPNSVKIGAFVSFIAAMAVLFLSGLYLWRFFYREEDDASTVRRVAKNSLAPIVLNLFNRAIEFAFAALAARILGPVGNGRYATAANIYIWFDIIANFGLDMYLMREVSRDRSRARQLLVNTSVLRLLLYLAAAPVLAAFLGGWQGLGSPLAGETLWTVALLYIGLLPNTFAYGLAGLFRGFEKHEIPAAIQTVTTIVKVTLGVLALVAGLGIRGIAGASILTNGTTLLILAVLARRLIWPHLPPARERVAWPLQRLMLSESWPLMVSFLLQYLFPGINILLLQRLQGDAVVGWYDAARKWVDALNLIPSVFTFAVFPVISQQAAHDRLAMRRTYHLSAKLLLIVALPAAVLVSLLATPLVGLLSGAAFLPDGAIALRLLIWSIPFGWINSLTNYALIALNRQRYVLVASGVRVFFTVVANLLLVSRWSYTASAWIMIGGELLLAILFYLGLRRQTGPVAWGAIVVRPLLAGLAMTAMAWLLAPVSLALALLASAAIYPLVLLLLRALDAEERAALSPLLPAPLRRER